MATPVEVVDDAVLSGRTRTTNNHAIAATHQAADSNAALPRHGRGGANAKAWRGDGVASASCGDGRIDDAALGCPEAGRAQFFGALTRTGRVRVLWRVASFWAALPSGLFAQKTLGTDQIISCGIGGGLFLSSRIEHRIVYGNRWLSIRFRPLLGAASSGRRPWSFRHSASRPGRGMVRRRGVRVRVHSTLVLSRVGKDWTEAHLTQGESGPSSDPRMPRPRRSIKQKRRLR